MTRSEGGMTVPFCPDGLQQRQEEVSKSKRSSKMFDHFGRGRFHLFGRRVPVPAYTDRIHLYFTDELTV